MSAGIDYGLGRTNIDGATGIRYGVISQHSVGQAWYDEAQPDYGEATCPKCGNTAIEYDGDKIPDNVMFGHGAGCADYMCEACEYVFDGQEAFGDEAHDWIVDDGEYKLCTCLDTNIFVLAAPYYTFAQYCSPCVPGAGDLDNPDDDGAKSFCLGHDWFEDGKAPYPVYSVETGELVMPDKA